MDYDDFGRIMRLLRYDGKGRVIDSLTYQYLNNTGRLGHLRNDVGSAVSGNDVDNQLPNNYAYDASGNMTQDVGSGIGEIRYNPYNLPTTLIKSGQTYQYRYDGSGKRIEKVQPNGSFECYRRGANGELFNILNSNRSTEYFGIIVFFYANEHEPVHVHGRCQGRESKAEIILIEGEIYEIHYSDTGGKRPLNEDEMTYFKELVEVKSSEIVQR